MRRIEFQAAVYQTSDWFEATLIKNGMSKRVLVGLPYYSWKQTFEEVVGERGFQVIWR